MHADELDLSSIEQAISLGTIAGGCHARKGRERAFWVFDGRGLYAGALNAPDSSMEILHPRVHRLGCASRHVVACARIAADGAVAQGVLHVRSGAE